MRRLGCDFRAGPAASIAPLEMKGPRPCRRGLFVFGAWFCEIITAGKARDAPRTGPASDCQVGRPRTAQHSTTEIVPLTFIRTERSWITDARGRRVPVAHSAITAQPAKDPPAPQLAKAVQFRRELDALATAVRRLSPPLASDPNRFHEERSEIARRIERLAASINERT